MFSLLVTYSGWSGGRGSMPVSRMLEYTSDSTKRRFRSDSGLDLDALVRLPAVFMAESGTEPERQPVRVGTIYKAVIRDADVEFKYTFDPEIPALKNADLNELASDLGIADWEFTRSHWAVKDTDFFRAIIPRLAERRVQPRVFEVSDFDNIEPQLVSLMMPFSSDFGPVLQVLSEAAQESGMVARRADDIWENPAVIQDVVSLIDRSRVVICDCSGRNPNVFYEIGIAHTLGREVILIVQSEADIPFDLRHLRYVQYLNNGEGRTDLKRKVAARLQDIWGC